MSELILRGFDLFLDKTHSAGKLSISPEITEIVFLVLGFLLVFAGAKLYRVVISPLRQLPDFSPWRAQSWPQRQQEESFFGKPE